MQERRKAIILKNPRGMIHYSQGRETLVRQKRSMCIFRRRCFSSDRGGKTRVMPKYNEDFFNAEQEGKEQV